jgi:hypothetical protein
MPASGSFPMNYTVTGGLSKAETEVELVPPKEYAQWMPQADENEQTIGNFIDVEIVAHTKDDPTSPPLFLDARINQILNRPDGGK